MRREVYCMYVGDGHLEPLVRDLLFDISQQMIRTGTKVHHLCGNYHGSIHTDGSTVSVGMMSGQVFTAEVYGQKTRFSGRYLVRPGDVNSKQGIWTSSGDPCPACGQIH
jgi:hypothetical protein